MKVWLTARVESNNESPNRVYNDVFSFEGAARMWVQRWKDIDKETYSKEIEQWNIDNNVDEDDLFAGLSESSDGLGYSILNDTVECWAKEIELKDEVRELYTNSSTI